MKMISVKIAELTGPALDWAVAVIALGLTVKKGSATTDLCVSDADGDFYGWISMDPSRRDIGEEYSPSTNWSQGGPLIDSFSPRFNVAHFRVDYSPCIDSTVLGGYGWGPTFLVAFCRSFVASCSVSEFVEVPADLLGESK